MTLCVCVCVCICLCEVMSLCMRTKCQCTDRTIRKIQTEDILLELTSGSVKVSFTLRLKVRGGISSVNIKWKVKLS